MPHLRYVWAEEADQRRADHIASRAIWLPFRVNQEWDRMNRTWDDEPQVALQALANYSNLMRHAEATIGRGGVAEFSPIVTDPVDMSMDSY